MRGWKEMRRIFKLKVVLLILTLVVSVFILNSAWIQAQNSSSVAAFTISNITPALNESVTFDATDVTPSSVQDEDSISYNWDFGDGTQASGIQVTHAFTTVDDFKVCLTLTDNNNNPKIISKLIFVGRPQGWTEKTHKSENGCYKEVFPEDKVLRMDITINAENFKTMEDNLAVMDGSNPVYVPVTLKFNNYTWWSVGMQYKANTTLSLVKQAGKHKYPFVLNFGKFAADYPEIKGQKFYGFKQLLCNNNWSDASFVLDVACSDIFRAGGVPTARGSFCRMYIDTGDGPVYWGLYSIFEQPEDQMVKTQFPNAEGNMYKSKGKSANWVTWNQDAFEKKTNKDVADWSDIKAAVTALNADRSDAAAWRAGLETVFDVKSFLRWLAINTAIVNTDSYGTSAQNYYLYQNLVNKGRLVWVPWDFNMSLTTILGSGMGGGNKGGKPRVITSGAVVPANGTIRADKDGTSRAITSGTVVSANGTIRVDKDGTPRVITSGAVVPANGTIRADKDGTPRAITSGTVVSANGTIRDDKDGTPRAITSGAVVSANGAIRDDKDGTPRAITSGAVVPNDGIIRASKDGKPSVITSGTLVSIDGTIRASKDGKPSVITNGAVVSIDGTIRASKDGKPSVITSGAVVPTNGTIRAGKDDRGEVLIRSDVGGSNLALSEVDNNWPLIRFLMDDPVYSNIYKTEMRKALLGCVNEVKVTAKMRRMHEMIRPYVVGPEGENATYSSLSNGEPEFDKALTDLLTHISNRQTALKEFLGSSIPAAKTATAVSDNSSGIQNLNPASPKPLLCEPKNNTDFIDQSAETTTAISDNSSGTQNPNPASPKPLLCEPKNNTDFIDQSAETTTAISDNSSGTQNPNPASPKPLLCEPKNNTDFIDQSAETTTATSGQSSGTQNFNQAPPKPSLGKPKNNTDFLYQSVVRTKQNLFTEIGNERMKKIVPIVLITMLLMGIMAFGVFICCHGNQNKKRRGTPEHYRSQMGQWGYQGDMFVRGEEQRPVPESAPMVNEPAQVLGRNFKRQPLPYEQREW
jgi:spore coat protein CotH